MVVTAAVRRRHPSSLPTAKGRSETPVPFTRIQLVADGMTAAIDRGDDAETERFFELYVAMVVGYANGHVAVARGFFLPTLCSFLLRIDRKRPMPLAAGQQLVDDLIADLESATTTSKLVDTCKTWFGRLVEISRPLKGPKILRLHAALGRLRRDFTSQQRLSEVARNAGFSVPAFVKIFKERTGTSLIPFVRALRVDYAQRLLTDTEMTLAAIASASGFHTTIRMNRSFQAVTGTIPRQRRTPAI